MSAISWTGSLSLDLPLPPMAPDSRKETKVCMSCCARCEISPVTQTHPPLYTGYGLWRGVSSLQYCLRRLCSGNTQHPLGHTAWHVALPGHLSAIGCSERILKLMDYSEGSFQDFSGHSDSVSSLVFSVSGSSLISSSDCLTHVWTLLH
ncbi:hypothetical protein GBAR_LOCUS26170 [Geodia barretti]|uniref:Uncharacterized protein n=1 Tax=Geodia barretti TaxID=519541 RepID=A0AA35THV4_GEOBA|nr:hypothetical protein GBAR_LOCUS26170 [Geodia barretti]